jgi:hypothetical protein
MGYLHSQTKICVSKITSLDNKVTVTVNTVPEIRVFKCKLQNQTKMKFIDLRISKTKGYKDLYDLSYSLIHNMSLTI